MSAHPWKKCCVSESLSPDSAKLQSSPAGRGPESGPQPTSSWTGTQASLLPQIYTHISPKTRHTIAISYNHWSSNQGHVVTTQCSCYLVLEHAKQVDWQLKQMFCIYPFEKIPCKEGKKICKEVHLTHANLEVKKKWFVCMELMCPYTWTMPCYSFQKSHGAVYRIWPQWYDLQAFCKHKACVIQESCEYYVGLCHLYNSNKLLSIPQIKVNIGYDQCFQM